MRKDRLDLYCAWLDGWQSITQLQSPPQFVTESLQAKLDLFAPIYLTDPFDAKRQVFALGVQDAITALNPSERDFCGTNNEPIRERIDRTR